MKVLIEILEEWSDKTDVPTAEEWEEIVMSGQPLPDDCEILTKEAYADLCLRASKGNCSEISTGSTVKIDVPDNNVGNIDCISRADARSLVVNMDGSVYDAQEGSRCQRRGQ